MESDAIEKIHVKSLEWSVEEIRREKIVHDHRRKAEEEEVEVVKTVEPRPTEAVAVLLLLTPHHPTFFSISLVFSFVFPTISNWMESLRTKTKKTNDD